MRPTELPEPESLSLSEFAQAGPDLMDEDDDVYYAALTRRRRVRKAAIAVALVAGLWGLKSLLTGEAEAPVAALVAPQPVERPTLPRIAPVVPTPQPAPAPMPVEAPVAAAEPPPKVAAAGAKRAPAKPAVTRFFAAPPPVRQAPEPAAKNKGRVPAPWETETEAPKDARAPAKRVDGAPLARPTALLWSEPGGAAVTLDGRYVGRTPINVSWDNTRVTELEVSLAGYDSALLELSPDTSTGLLKVKLTRSEQEPDVEPEEEVEAAPVKVDLRKALPERNTPDRAMPEPKRN